MAIAQNKSGSKLRHVQGPDLKMLEDEIESLPFKVDVLAVNRVGSNWYVHFYIPTKEFDQPKVKKEIAEKTKIIKE